MSSSLRAPLSRTTARPGTRPNNKRVQVDPGDYGRSYAFARGEKVRAGHEAVLSWPHSFDPVEE
jgi:hypothetical protein